MAAFEVDRPDLSPGQVLELTMVGLNEMMPPGGPDEARPPVIRGAIRLVLHVPDEFAEIVQEAAARQEVPLRRIEWPPTGDEFGG